MGTQALAGLMLACLPLCAAAASMPEWFRIFSEPVKASSLIGREVKSAHGESVGTVRDLVFDLEHNRVHRAIVGEAKYPMYMLKTPPGSTALMLEIPEKPVKQTWEGMRLMPASRLIGARVAAGEVIDVVLDAFWGNVAFAVVGTADAVRPVPLDAFRQRGGHLALRVPARKLESVDAFSLAELHAGLKDRTFLQRTARVAHQLTRNSGSEPE